MAKALFYILNNADLLDELLEALCEEGINGGTILEGSGMGSELARSGHVNSFNSMTGSLRALLKPERNSTKTLMFVLAEEKISKVIEVIERVVGDLNEAGTGLAFAFPIDFIKGLKL